MTTSWFPEYPTLLTLHMLKDLPKPEQSKKLKKGPDLGLPINIQWQEKHGQEKPKCGVQVNHIK